MVLNYITLGGPLEIITITNETPTGLYQKMQGIVG